MAGSQEKDMASSLTQVIESRSMRRGRGKTILGGNIFMGEEDGVGGERVRE